MNRRIKALLAVAVAFVLCFGGFTSAFAAGDPVIGSESTPVRAAIAKQLKMPIGTLTPNATFNYTVTKISVDGETAPALVAGMPNLNTSNLSVVFTNADTGTVNGDVKTVILETGDLFNGVAWTHAGVYVYEIEEQLNSYTIVDPNHETMAYSTGKYTLNVYVKQGTGANAGSYYVYALGAVVAAVDNDEQAVGDKVDPTPGTGTGSDYSEMVFTNIYVKTNGAEDPEDPDPTTASTLSVSKAVEGDFADTTWYFDFSVTVAAPSLVYNPADLNATPPVYYAYIVDGTTVVSAADLADANKNNATVAGTDTRGQAYISFTSGTANTIKLKNDQRLVFINTPVGTSYNVTEAGVIDFIATASFVYDGSVPTAVSAPGTQNTALTVANKLVGEGANSADFVNVRDVVTPMGVFLNNLPFYVLIAVAIGALIVFVVVKSRKRNNQ